MAEAQGEGRIMFTAIHTKKDGRQYIYEGEGVPMENGDYKVFNWIRKVLTDADSRGTDQQR